MKTHHFIIVATGPDPDDDVTYDSFYEAGCADASVGWSGGVFLLRFHREAERFHEAVVSAYRDVGKTLARVLRFEPDNLVDKTDILARSGLASSDLERLRDLDDEMTYPTPIARASSDDPLWDWADVAMWLHRHDKIDRDATMEAIVLRDANAMLASGRAIEPTGIGADA